MTGAIFVQDQFVPLVIAQIQATRPFHQHFQVVNLPGPLSRVSWWTHYHW